MNRKIGSDKIKIIAMICMLIDHIGAGIVEKIYYSTTDYNMVLVWERTAVVLRSVGRIAYPLFAYMLVKGFFYTKNRFKHIINLIIFAIISEIPFDLLGNGTIWDPSYQNVMITLTLGTLMMWALEIVRENGLQNSIRNEKIRKLAYGAFAVVLVICTARFALLCHSDYGARGIVTIAIIYMLRDDKLKLLQLGPILFILNIFIVTFITQGNMHATIRYCEFEIYAIMAFPIMYADSGHRNEKNSRVLKWFGYWFYPLHQLLIYLISLLVS